MNLRQSLYALRAARRAGTERPENDGAKERTNGRHRASESVLDRGEQEGLVSNKPQICSIRAGRVRGIRHTPVDSIGDGNAEPVDEEVGNLRVGIEMTVESTRGTIRDRRTLLEGLFVPELEDRITGVHPEDEPCRDDLIERRVKSVVGDVLVERRRREAALKAAGESRDRRGNPLQLALPHDSDHSAGDDVAG